MHRNTSPRQIGHFLCHPPRLMPTPEEHAASTRVPVAVQTLIYRPMVVMALFFSLPVLVNVLPKGLYNGVCSVLIALFLWRLYYYANWFMRMSHAPDMTASFDGVTASLSVDKANNVYTLAFRGPL